MEFDTSKSVEIETLNGLMTVQASLNDVVYSASLEFKEIPLDTHMDAELDLLPTSVEVEDSTQIKVKLTVRTLKQNTHTHTRYNTLVLLMF